MSRFSVGIALVLLLLGAPTAAQTALEPLRVRGPALASVAPSTPPPDAADPAPSRLRAALSTPGGAFAASLALPGAGQAALGLRRWALYALVEAGLWTAHFEARSDVSRLTRGYRDLAWEAARAPTTGPRVDGTWGYYETMASYLSSGAFDLDPALAGTQPETDVATYNGYVWSLARSLYLPGGGGEPGAPGYERALEYYHGHAAGPRFLWSWEGREGELARFRQLIDAADDEARAATRALGLVLANHFVAAVDAIIVARSRQSPSVRLESRIEAHGARLGWTVQTRISIPGVQ